MKNQFLNKLSVAVLLSAVSFSYVNAQKVKGSGTVVSQDRTVTDFIDLDVDGIFDVVISQGDAPSVKVEADDNLQSFIKVENVGDKLKIYDEKEENIKKYTKMTVYVTVRQIEKITLDMVGKVTTKDTLRCLMLGVKSLESTGRTELLISTPKLTVNLDGISDLKLSGKADAVELNHKGSGNIEGFGLVSGDMVVNYNGVGNIDVNAQNSIAITSSGVGHVNYKGAATVIKSDASGAGSIKKVK